MPAPSSHVTKERTPAEQAIAFTEAGYVGKAERALNDVARVAPYSEETLNSLIDKHPIGAVNPFQVPLNQGTPYPNLPDVEHVATALRSFSQETSPGPSGWSVKLTKLAATSPPFLAFLRLICSQMATGDCPARALICSARLTPLIKEGGGVRPVAVGEVFYRLGMKTTFLTNFDKKLLSTRQFGVGSSGGVKPITRAIQAAVDGDPLFPYTHLVSLDATNAFNTLPRSTLASALSKYAPSLSRVAAWAHNVSLPLLYHSPENTHTIESAEGVRQGDPMSSLFFSIAIRDTVDLLQDFLGSDYLVMAYLDDVFVLGNSSDGLDLCLDFFSHDDAPLTLNSRKCKLFDLRNIDASPVTALGTCIGSRSARATFLADRTSDFSTKALNLNSVPKQHALLILRKSMQLKQRHLLRSMQSDDILAQWEELDSAICSTFDSIRGRAPTAGHRDRDRTILSLPTSLGGMGLMSHVDTAPLAYQAASHTSSYALRPLVPGIRLDTDARSQRELCHEVILTKQQQLMTSLSSRDRVLTVEAASQLGRRWLDLCPSSSRFSLSDGDVQANLMYRTLLSGYDGQCSRCGSDNEPSHDEACPARQDHRISRHESVKHAIAAGLQAISTLEVEIEPFMPDLRRRNDVRIRHVTDAGRPSPAEEYDIKIVALSAPSHRRSLAVTDAVTRPDDETLLRQTYAKVQKVLQYQAKRKVDALPSLSSAQSTRVPFFPIVISAGGIAEQGAFDKFKSWKGWATSKTSHTWMMSSVSVSLAKARGRTFLFQ
jgi:hypothetical protein